MMGCEQEGWSLQVFSFSVPQAVIILQERPECGPATPALAPHAKILAGRQDHHRPLPHSFSTAYSYSMYTNHSLFSNVFDLAALTRHSRNNVCFHTKSNSRATRFVFNLLGGWDLDKRSSVRVSVAPAGSLYCTDWLMYSDQPESTILAGKQA